MAGLDAKRDGGRGGSLLGSLRDALAAAGRDDPRRATPDAAAMKDVTPIESDPVPPTLPAPVALQDKTTGDERPTAAAAAALARAPKQPAPPQVVDLDDQPAATRKAAAADVAKLAKTQAVGDGLAAAVADDDAGRTQIVRGKPKLQRGAFAQDPVVGWLVVVGGPGLGSYRPIFEGNNAVGRDTSNRIAIDFGDESISQAEQAYIRYDGADRSFLFVPNMAKTNVVAVNDARPAQPVKLKAMDLITMGRTQLVFVPFCGSDFDWGDLGDIRS